MAVATGVGEVAKGYHFSLAARLPKFKIFRPPSLFYLSSPFDDSETWQSCYVRVRPQLTIHSFLAHLLDVVSFQSVPGSSVLTS